MCGINFKKYIPNSYQISFFFVFFLTKEVSKSIIPEMLPVYTVKNPKLIQCNGLYYFEDFVTQKYSKIGIKYLKKNIMLNNEFKFGFGFFEILDTNSFPNFGSFHQNTFFYCS